MLPKIDYTDFLQEEKACWLILEPAGYVRLTTEGGTTSIKRWSAIGAAKFNSVESIDSTDGEEIQKAADRALKSMRAQLRKLDTPKLIKALDSTVASVIEDEWVMAEAEGAKITFNVHQVLDHYKLNVAIWDTEILPAVTDSVDKEAFYKSNPFFEEKAGEMSTSEGTGFKVVEERIFKEAERPEDYSEVDFENESWAVPIAPKELKPAAIEVNPKLSLEDMLAHSIRSAVQSEFTADMLTHVLHKKLNEYGIKPKVKTVVYENKTTGQKVDMEGAVHKDFDKVLQYARARVNIFLKGETGSGKTTCAYLVGKALGLKTYSKSVGVETGVHEFMGYTTLDGTPVHTDFERAYKDGGVFLIDEIDGGNPNVLLVLNQALSSDECTFASGTYKKHPDFICLAGANTWGFGATNNYVGRNPIDKATLNRFVMVEYGYDEDLELEICGNEAWARKVQAIRAKAKEKRVKAIISPRASINGAKLLAAGVPEATVLQDVVYGGLTEDEINLIKL